MMGLFPDCSYFDRVALWRGHQVWVGSSNGLPSLVGFQALLHEPQAFEVVETETQGERRPWHLLTSLGSCFCFILASVYSFPFVLVKQCVFKKMLIHFIQCFNFKGEGSSEYQVYPTAGKRNLVCLLA